MTYDITFLGKTVQARGPSALSALKNFASHQPSSNELLFKAINVERVDSATGGLVSGEFTVPGLEGQDIVIQVQRVGDSSLPQKY